ncbi:hypothetical protein BN946_scf184634.g2 [Trametes cinnabarina]|uniref:Uncharacterized protein n=1 Tax=Pycnoporus cinnabarinus TaxID=5643 RepID=A0A060SVB1_PYCCI|nr:hypothetical protein BN946_scf184634.g2 [Trametes cinnabarina]
MRLLNTDTRKFERFEHPQDVRYAILSHVWEKSRSGRPQEQSYQDLLDIQNDYGDDPIPLDEPRLSPKIRGLCRIALRDGYEFVWLDSACINQSSSAELSEAINSMYLWYSQASICYAYLSDVTVDPKASLPPITQFRKSGWFGRGWTLQELIAPHIVIFLSKEWEVIDTKRNLAEDIEAVTGIDSPILTHEADLSTISVARRMSWASSRKTTKVEDEAYCLMGIFGVHISTVYGEGTRAFFRLQEEICKHIADDSIFVWGRPPSSEYGPFTTFISTSPPTREGGPQESSARNGMVRSYKQCLFAPSPRAFRDSADIVPISRTAFARRLGMKRATYPSRTPTPFGLQTRLPLVFASSAERPTRLLLAILACQSSEDSLIALALHPVHDPDGSTEQHSRFVVGHRQDPRPIHEDDSRVDSTTVVQVSDYSRFVSLSPSEVNVAKSHIPDGIPSIYILSHPSGDIHEADQDRKARKTLCMPTGPIDVTFAPWCEALLGRHGFRIDITGSHGDLRQHLDSNSLGLPASIPPRRFLSIYKDSSLVATLFVGHCVCHLGQSLRLLSVTVQYPGELHQIRYVSSVDHKVDDRDHVQSWSYHAGYVSREEEIPKGAPGDLAGRKMRLCLGRGVSGSGAFGIPKQHVDSFVLSLEIQGLDVKNSFSGNRLTGEGKDGWTGDSLEASNRGRAGIFGWVTSWLPL